MSYKLIQGVLLIGLLGSISWVFSCSPEGAEEIPIKYATQKSGEIIVLTRYGPTTFYRRHGENAGVEHDLATSFANYLGVTPRFKVLGSINDLFDALDRGEGDFIAAGLTMTDHRQTKYRFGPSCQSIRQEVVCHRNSTIPQTLQDLTQVTLLIPVKSSYEERLTGLKRQYPGIRWTGATHLSTEEILNKVANQEYDCTVADSHIVDLNQRYFPDLVMALPLTREEDLAWVLPQHAEKLQAHMNGWVANIKQTDVLERIMERYYGHIELFDYVDSKRFHRHITRRLPRYEPIFQEAADYYQFPWKLIAAQAYQESHWNAKAKSPTGVRGIMMLTKNTAKELGIQNRLNPTKSIFGGTRYLKRLYHRLPKEIQEPDRTWMALAAYNVGYGHLRDAMKLATQIDKNPFTWKDLKTTLPLLSRKVYYKKLKFGYARGIEPVRYVKRIRHYQDLLKFFSPEI